MGGNREAKAHCFDCLVWLGRGRVARAEVWKAVEMEKKLKSVVET